MTFPDMSDLALIRHKELTENERHIRRRMQGVGLREALHFPAHADAVL